MISSSVVRNTSQSHDIHSVTSYALPWTITQHESRLLCLEISSPVSFTACVSLLSRFILATTFVTTGPGSTA